MVMKKMLHRRKFNRKAAILSVLSFSLMQSMVYAETNTVATQISTSVPSINDPSQKAITPEPAVAKITKEQAIEKVISLFPKLKDAKADNVELGDTHSFPLPYQNVWSINWQFTFGNSSYGFSSKVDSISGDLLQTNLSYPQDEDNVAYYPPKFTKEEALELAKAFIQKASPSIPLSSLQSSDQMRFANQSLFGPVQYDFFFNVQVNGIVSPSETLSISVNGNGEVTSYYRNVLTANYPSAIPHITLEEATKKYEPGLNFTLQYTPVYHNDSREKDWFLGWVQPGQGDVSIDAQTGDYINFMGDAIDPKGLKYNDVTKTDELFTATTGKGESQLLTAEQAEEIVKHAANIPEGRKLARNELTTYWQDKNKKIWNLAWMEQTPSGPYGSQSNAAVDAKTGQILDYSENSFGPPWMQPKEEKADSSKVAITKEAALEKALKIINLIYPQASEELKWINPNPFAFSKDNESAFSFQFQRFYKDIPVGGDVTSIVLDTGGKLSSYHSSRTDQLESAVKQLKASTTKDDATASFLELTMEQLQYSNFGGYYSDNNYQKQVVKLVYKRIPKDSTKIGYVIDAADGRFRATYDGVSNLNDQAVIVPKDIIGHWAQKDLETMVQHHILQANSSGELNPNAAITLGDWMDMIAKATNPQYANQYSMNNRSTQIQFQDVNEKNPYYASAQLFIQYKWLDPKQSTQLHPEQSLTREKLAESIAHIIKYNKLADYLQDKLPLTFRDSNQINEKGFVSLVVQLGLLDGSEGSFNPKGAVSKAEAATILMRLVNLQGKLDQRIVQ